jgi:predicted transposase YbfD/YdcC|tara:strand:- start:85 stop:1287 length:1203 start_codon:yes stop_codon:yes gene_type:complete
MARRLTIAQKISRENEEMALLFFEKVLADLPDPRRPQGVRYPLRSVIVIALLAMVCGAEDAQAMELWGDLNIDWLNGFLDLPHQTPSQDVYLSVFAALNPAEFSKVFREWANLLSLQDHFKTNANKQIAIDGKTSRGSIDRENNRLAIHTVSAWLCDAGLVLSQEKTNEKSNEITAIPELLKTLDISKRTISIDAMGTQVDIATLIKEKEGEYLLAVKNNQPTLHHDIQEVFESKTEKIQFESFSDIDKGHGRIEERKIEICRDISLLTTSDKWDGISFFAKVTRIRTILKDNKTSEEIAYYIGSDETTSAEIILGQVRKHWSIENNLHWVLDVAFREDQARHRAKNTASNMATLRHFVLNVLKVDKGRKFGVSNSRKQAGWNMGYLVNLICNSSVWADA